MWRKAVQAYEDFLQKQKASAEEVACFRNKIARLQAKQMVSHRKPAGINGKSCSLFDTLGSLSYCDNRAVGHWCEMAAAAARAREPFRAQGSYEKDFGNALAFDRYSLARFLSDSAQNKALGSYVSDVQAQLDAASSADKCAA